MATGPRSSRPDCETMVGSPTDPRAVEGTVTAQLPSALYRVALEGGRDITAHLTGDARRNFIRVLVGDRVRVVLAPGDLTRGRIVEKL